MPALTHGRVVNGFNSLPRNITHYKSRCSGEKTKNSCTSKESCCGKPIQPAGRRPRNSLIARVNKFDSGTKMDSTVTTGRSFAAKRAIARRVTKQTKCSENGGYKNVSSCCNLPTVTKSQPRTAYSNGGNVYNCKCKNDNESVNCKKTNTD